MRLSLHAISFFLVLQVISIANCRAQIHPEAGSFFHQQFMPYEHGGHNQSWALLEDENGLMYIGNGNGLLEYDGVEWKMIEVAGGQVALSLALGADNRIFVGSVDDFGEIRADSLGNSVFKSMLPRVPEEHHGFEDVWETVATSDGVFFRTRSAIFHLDRQDSLHIFKPEERFERVHTVGDNVYSVGMNVGLKKFNGSGFELVPGGELFENLAIWLMNRQPDGSIFIVTREGTFTYNDDTFELFETEIGPVLEELSVYNSTEIEGIGYAHATIRGGVILTDYQGNILRRIDDQVKLPTNQTTNVLTDRFNNLWISTTNGLARIEISSPITYFDRHLGVSSEVQGIKRYDETLFISSSSSINFIEESASGTEPARFTSIPVTTNNHRSFLSTENGLLLTSSSGLLQVNREGTTVAIPDLESISILRSDYDPEIILLGHIDGLALITFRDGEWIKLTEVEGVTEQAFGVIQDKHGIIWISTDFQGLIRAEMDGIDDEQPKIDRFDIDEQFNSVAIQVFTKDGEAVFLTNTGIYKPNSPWNPDNPFTPELSDLAEEAENNISFAHLAKGHDGRLWAATGLGNGYVQNLNNPPDSLFQGALGRIPDSTTQVIYPEEDGIVWFGDQNGLIRFDSRSDYPDGINFDAFVRAVTAGEELLFGGNPGNGFNPATLTYQQNDLRFRFGTNFFEDIQNTQYQVKLAGFDDEWSAWSSETFRDYTNLPHGDFIMQVRAMNTYGRISSIGEYSFSILPPWWLTWWAFSLYLILGAGFIYGIDRYRHRKMRKREARLEAIVNKRTEELRKEKKITEAQAEKLKQLDAEKSRFFANISHEFRTPLTLTIAPLENLSQPKYGVLTKEGKAQVDMATRNAKRLMRLVTQLLDLARFEANLFKLKPETAQLNRYLRYLTSRFVGASERYKITLNVQIPDEEIIASFDPEQFEKVITNLLSNAFKFTQEGGTVTISLKKEQDEAVITVEDTGQGIDPDHLPRLFDRFYQAEKSELQPGTGIGLALVKEITEQHGGQISVESEPDKGTSFEVRLPLAESEEAAVTDLPLPELESGLEDELLPDKTLDVDDDDPEIEDDDRKTLLIVDDNRDIRNYLREHFSDKYRVQVAATGNQALGKIKKLPPDIIISDVMMPDGDGFSLLKNLRSDPETDFLPIILLTARAEAEDKLEGLGIGADDYLTKPFSMEEVSLRVSNLIDRQMRLQKYYKHQGGHLTNGKEVLHPDSVEADSVDDQYLEKVRQVIQKQMQDEDFSVEVLAKELHQSRTHLFRRLKDLTGESPSNLIKRMRLERGAELLQQKAGTVSEVAYSTGFKSVAQFSKSFRGHFEKTPTEFITSNN